MKLRRTSKAVHGGRRKLRRLSLAGGAVALGISATAGLLATSVSSASATSTSAVYAPVPIYLGTFVTDGIISPSSHLEQAVRDAQGNYWISVYSGTGVGDLLEVNGVTRQAEAVVELGNGFAPIDGLAANSMVYFVNFKGGSDSVIQLDPSKLPAASTTGLPIYSLAEASSAVTFPGSSVFSSTFVSSNSIGTDSAGSDSAGSVYITSGKDIYGISSSGTVTTYATSSAFDSAMTVYDGYLYAGSSNNKEIFGFPLSNLSSTSTNSPTVTITANTFTGNLGDFSGQMVNGAPELWFLREFTGTVGYADAQPASGSATASEYKISTGAGSTYSGYVEGMVPGRTGLWISTGAINGNQGSGAVNFYRIDPSNLNASGSGTSATISPTLVPVPPTLATLSSDDFALDNNNPIVQVPFTSCQSQFIAEQTINAPSGPACPVLTLQKTDNVNHATNYNSVFQYFLTAGVSTSSQVAEGQALTINDPLPTGMVATAASGSGWSCASTTFPATTVSCTYAIAANQALLPGQSAPVLTVTVRAPSSTTVSSVVNQASVLSNDAATVYASDTVSLSTAVTPVTSPPVTAPSVTTTTTPPTTTAPPTTAVVAVAANSAPPTTAAPVTKTVTVPSVHTGKPWSSETYWFLAALSAVIGFSLILPWRRKSISLK
jgi:hypothetical protein